MRTNGSRASINSSKVPTATPSRCRPSTSQRWTGSAIEAASKARFRLWRRQFARTTASSSRGARFASWLLTLAPTLMSVPSLPGVNLGAVLPNLIVIGAAKCGTTSLHEYLDEHPEISMSREKELHFFVDGKNWGRGLAWYESHFDSAAPVRGESSPGYSAFPLYRGVPERMAETIPEAKLIYLVRDPVQRIVSHYTHRTVNWPEMGTLEEALADPHIREWLVTPSRYWLQLEQYLSRFPAERILVVDSDELRASRIDVLARIFAFLDVDPSFRSPRFRRAHNSATGRIRRNRA